MRTVAAVAAHRIVVSIAGEFDNGENRLRRFRCVEYTDVLMDQMSYNNGGKGNETDENVIK